VIVLFFGGGWVAGKPQQMAGHARYFARAGYVAISAKYRVRNKDGKHLTPYDCVEDGKSAVRYLREHAAELGIDRIRSSPAAVQPVVTWLRVPV